MTTNPYQAPQVAGGINEATESREYLLAVAKRQKSIMYCILAQILLFAVGFYPPYVAVIPAVLRGLLAIIVYLATAICLGRMAARLHGIGQGVLYGVLGVIPVVSLICLFFVNQRATKLLKRHGIAVGLMGADVERI